jgi:hypothetical protein
MTSQNERMRKLQAQAGMQLARNLEKRELRSVTFRDSDTKNVPRQKVRKFQAARTRKKFG